MLAGYLPFDDDPANPEGDNINLLYKYIVSTPLTFPEYVTPHARDLLRRILVPDPRKRADLFEVARHSWLSEYAHVVGFITSSTTTTRDIANTTVGVEEEPEAPLLNRSASVREASKTQKQQPAVGELGRKHGNVDQDDAELHAKPQKDNKRRTVQVEYVAPRSETVRGAPPVSSSNGQSGSRDRSGSQEMTIHRKPVSSEKPLPKDPPASAAESSRRPASGQKPQTMAPPPRPGRDVPSAPDAGYTNQVPTIARPPTGNSMGSTASRSGSMGLVTRGSYGQPVAPTVAGTNVQGRMSQPSQGRSYSQQTIGENRPEYGSRPSVPSKFAKVSGLTEADRPESTTTRSSHKRSNTVGNFIQDRFFSRTGSKKDHDRNQEKKYPPVSMSNKLALDGENPRKSMESRRSISFGFSKKRSGSMTGSSESKPRRMSNILASWSLKAIGIGKDTTPPPPDTPSYAQSFEDQQNVVGKSQTTERYDMGDAGYDANRESPVREDRKGPQSPGHQTRHASEPLNRAVRMSGGNSAVTQFRRGESALTTESESSIERYSQNQSQNQHRRPHQYPAGINETSTRNGTHRGVLQKPHRKFVDAYDSNTDGKAGRTAGSSGAARKVMDFFRRRGDRDG